jgi:DNA ligase-1
MVRVYLFDILFLDDTLLFDNPYQDRWNLLSKTCKNLTLATRIVNNDKVTISQFFQDALAAGHEGILIKYLQSHYYPGERKKFWLKLKEAVLLDLLIIAADWGSGRRSGWLSNYYLAAFDPETGTFHEIGKTFKGLTDEEFKLMTQTLQTIKTHETQYTVFVKPQIIVEVAFNEIQKSPQYPSGYALRFARIKRVRPDKIPTETTTLQEIARLYERQFEKKARI